VVTNAVVLLTLVQHKIETGADVRKVLIQGDRTHVRRILMPPRRGDAGSSGLPIPPRSPAR
jgi:Cu/Ag efflux pump CusA